MTKWIVTNDQINSANDHKNSDFIPIVSFDNWTGYVIGFNLESALTVRGVVK